jgi:predicted KAP-like P-loop ATPase
MQDPRDIDSPLSDLSKDILGRGVYAQRIADMILGWRGNHSAVFAIYGQWGSGKTSLKNFVLEKLKDAPEDAQPIIVEFNPWQWDGPRQVTEAFFAAVMEEIGRKNPRGGQEVSERLGRYAAYFTLGASIAESAGKVLPLFVPGVGPLATILGESLKKAGEQAKVASEAKLKNESLHELRGALINSIQELKRTILVTIDDVDRLTPPETATLFQLLKSNADFPSTVYLVLCDREVVEHNLDAIVDGHGHDYIEKIVQLGLPLPKAYPEQLRAFVLHGIENVVGDAGGDDVLDRTRFFNFFHHHAAPFFSTMRDANRFLANVAILLPSVIHGGDADVDLVDFIGIELLRMFDYGFYEAIYKRRERITGREGVPSEDKQFAKDLTARASRAESIAIFRELFPRFGAAKTLLTRPRGVAHSRFFDRYFAFSIPSDQYSPAEENDVLSRRRPVGFR